jgi:Family of unknown function (DUF6624)
VDEELARELAEMAGRDQEIRPRRSGEFSPRISTDELIAWRRVDVTNTDRLREIVEDRGWPGRTLVGEDGAEHAWLLAQHADHQLDSQRLFLEALRQAVASDEAPARHAAYLIDRVAMNEGRPQTYGTQITEMRNGEGIPWPVEDPERLDERRESVGLPPFAEYVAQWRGLA